MTWNGGFLRFLFFRIGRDFVFLQFTVDHFPSKAGHSVLWTVDAFQKSSLGECTTPIRDVSVVELNVDGDGRWVREEPLVDIVVSAEPIEDLVVDWDEPGDALSHFLSEVIAHWSHLRAGIGRNFAVIRIYQLRKSAKLLRQSSVLPELSHDLGGIQRLLEKHPGACPQQTPRLWPQERMHTNEAHRVKTPGVTAVQTSSDAPAPSQIGTLAGASALPTTTNQSTRQAGGGRCVSV